MDIDSNTLKFKIVTYADISKIKELLKALNGGRVPLEDPLIQEWQQLARLTDEVFAKNYHTLHIKLLSSIVDYYEEYIDAIQDCLTVDLEILCREG